MFDHILVPLDGSTPAESALPHAVTLAHAFQARCTLLHVVAVPRQEEIQSIDPLAWRVQRDEARAYLINLVWQLRSVGVEADMYISEGHPAEQVVQFAHAHAVDLIIVNAHGRGARHPEDLGSMGYRIAQCAQTSILFTRSSTSVQGLAGARYSRILLPLDGSQRAECTLAPTTVLALEHDAEVLIAHVVVAPQLTGSVQVHRGDLGLVQEIVEFKQQLAARYLDELRTHVCFNFTSQLLVDDDPVCALHELAQHDAVDLIVLCAHGCSGCVKWPYGSIATSFIQRGHTATLVVQDLTPHSLKMTAAEVASQEYRGH